MSKLFDPEGNFAQYGGKLGDLMWLNVLTLLFCFPVVTAGGSLAAMHYVLLKLHRDEEIAVTKMFFKSFRENWKQAGILFMIFAAVIYLLMVCAKLVISGQCMGFSVYLYLLTAMLVLCVCNWTLILQSRYCNSVLATMKLSINLTFVYPLRSFAMTLLALLPVVLLLVVLESWIIVAMAGITLAGFLQTTLYSGILSKLESIHFNNGE